MQAEIKVEKHRPPFYGIVLRAPILLIEHIAVGKICLGDDVIREVFHIDPFREFGKQGVIRKVAVERIFADAQEFVFRALKRSSVAANDVHGIRVDAVMESHIIFVLVLIKVVNTPVFAVDIYDRKPCFHLLDMKPLYRFHEERISEPCTCSILPGIAQHERFIR